MRASDLEFRLRFWIIALLFYAAALVRGRFAVIGIIGDRLGPVAATALCLLAFAAAALLRTWAAAYLDPEIIQAKTLDASGLVADGPYRHVRNPLYLGTILIGVGFGFFFGPLGAALLVAGLVVLTLRLIAREEAELAAAQSDAYREYVRRVPRLVPSLAPRTPRGRTVPHWGKAFRGELMCWLFLASAVAFFALDPWISLAGRVRTLEFGVLLAIGIHFLIQPRRRPA